MVASLLDDHFVDKLCTMGHWVSQAGQLGQFQIKCMCKSSCFICTGILNIVCMCNVYEYVCLYASLFM